MNTILIGASGFGREVLWVCRRLGMEVVGFCDDAQDKQTGSFCDLPLLGKVEQAATRFPTAAFHCAIGNNRNRQAVAMRAAALGWTPVTLIDPSAVVAPDARIGAGSYVGIGSVVSCQARIGDHVLINHHVTVGHDVTIGDYGQLCPGVRVSGGCGLGTGAFAGSNAVLIPGVQAGDWSVIGAGSVVLKDLPVGGTLARVR